MRRLTTAVLVSVLAVGCGADVEPRADVEASTTTVSVEAEFFDAVQAEVPEVAGVGAVSALADGLAVCEQARGGLDGRAPQDVLINDHHVNLDDVKGRFARLAVDRLCPDQQTAIDDAVAFDALMRSVITTTAAPPTTQPPRPAPRPRPQAPVEPAPEPAEDIPSRLVLNLERREVPCCDTVQTDTFTVSGAWRLEFDIGWVLSPGPNSCSMSGAVRTPDGRTIGLDPFQGTSGERHYSASGTFYLMVYRRCDTRDATTGVTIRVYD